MLLRHFLRVTSQNVVNHHAIRKAVSIPQTPTSAIRSIHVDGRNRLSNFWAPTGGIAPKSADDDDSHALLVRAGYLRQAYSGIFHLLPLGLRVQEKTERLLDKYMRSLGASKVSLSSISSGELWRRTGRLTAGSSELFQLKDRKDVDFLLSPTHEEEITALVASIVKSYKELPLRLYQVTRKYRDERRPRQGLLRAREFVMKDLYTFDYSSEAALQTYQSVRNAYASFFNELKIPYLVAEADSGNIGGTLSHEYHFVTPKGEDNVISCSTCDYVANEELAEKFVNYQTASQPAQRPCRWTGISQDRRTLVFAYWYPSVDIDNPGLAIQDDAEVNLHVMKAAFPELDAGVEGPLELFLNAISTEASAPTNPRFRTLHVFDGQIQSQHFEDLIAKSMAESRCSNKLQTAFYSIPSDIISQSDAGRPLDLVRIKPGDSCPRCKSPSLHVSKAVELGHTFHLGTRYSKPLEAAVAIPTELQDATDEPGGQRTLQMGCHGIGVSRMIGAVASIMADGKGLNWPRVIAPFEVVIIPRKGFEEDAMGIYDSLSRENNGPRIDAIIDDRQKHDLGWMLNDADLIGYPVVVVLGAKWKKERRCEVQCRRLSNLREDVEIDGLGEFVASLLDQL